MIQAGASGVGIAAVQLAKRAGATVIATAGSDEKLARLRDEFGLDHGVNYRATRFVDAVRGPEGQEGTRAFLEKRKPSWAGKGGT